ncbi:hypothetical protein Dip510_001509 [Elusimicrobium posterum]|uniref:hypothetical protein n=1 Tax=Elusimicrobium posterum TaxID=3116653 RepID=UPI003C74C2FC
MKKIIFLTLIFFAAASLHAYKNTKGPWVEIPLDKDVVIKPRTNYYIKVIGVVPGYDKWTMINTNIIPLIHEGSNSREPYAYLGVRKWYKSDAKDPQDNQVQFYLTEGVSNIKVKFDKSLCYSFNGSGKIEGCIQKK